MREPARAEDALQEVSSRVWRFLPKYDARRGSLYGWLSSIARHQCLTELAKQSKYVPLRDGYEDGSAGERFWAMTDPLAILARRCDLEQLRAMVDRLPGPSQRALVLFHYEGRSSREVASMLGIREATLRTRLHRAREALLDQMRRQDYRPAEQRVEARR